MAQNALSRWLFNAHMTQVQLGELTGIDQALISKYVIGRARPGLQHALLIQDATKGEVPVETWRAKRRKRRAA